MIYLLHFEKKFKHAQHYIGYTENLFSRIKRHETGDGARLLRAVSAAGIKYKLAKVWAGDRKMERKLKNRKNSKFLCPICKSERKKQNG